MGSSGLSEDEWNQKFGDIVSTYKPKEKNRDGRKVWKKEYGNRVKLTNDEE